MLSVDHHGMHFLGLTTCGKQHTPRHCKHPRLSDPFPCHLCLSYCDTPQLSQTPPGKNFRPLKDTLPLVPVLAGTYPDKYSWCFCITLKCWLWWWISITGMAVSLLQCFKRSIASCAKPVRWVIWCVFYLFKHIISRK